MNRNNIAQFALQAAAMVVLFAVYHLWGFWPAVVSVGVLLVITVIINSRR